jgi:hypothetical protein
MSGAPLDRFPRGCYGPAASIAAYLSMRHAKATTCRPATVPAVSFVVFDEPSASGGPCEGTFDDPTSWQKHEAALCLGELDDFKGDAFVALQLRWAWRRCSPDRHGPGSRSRPSPPGWPGRRGRPRRGHRHWRGDMERQQMAERVDRQMQLGAALALGAVIVGARAAFRGRAQGPAVKDRGCRLGRAARSHAQYGAKVVRQGARRQPALRLLVNPPPWAADRSASPARRSRSGSHSADR